MNLEGLPSYCGRRGLHQAVPLHNHMTLPLELAVRIYKKCTLKGCFCHLDGRCSGGLSFTWRTVATRRRRS